MQNSPTSRPVAIMVAVIFFAAAGIYYWRIVDQGPRFGTVFPAILFTLAGVLWVAARWAARRL